MARRQIIEIDEAKCDGCGQCVSACAEGAIQLVGGKAKLVSDAYCDGLGACLGECPQGAITIIEREAEAFDEAAVQHAQKPVAHAGCPGMAVRDLRLNVVPAATTRRPPQPTNEAGTPSLAHWPIQLRLVPPNAPFLRNADLFLVADCVPFACAGFHEKVLRQRPIVIGCPKLDDGQAYVDKLAEMLVRSEIQSITVVHMEVPCCTGLVRIAAEALRLSRKEIPLHDITISINGEVLA